MQLTSGSSILRSDIWEHGFTAWICLEACAISQAGRSFTVNKFGLRFNWKISRCPLCPSFSLQPLPAFVVCPKKSDFFYPVLPSPFRIQFQESPSDHWGTDWDVPALWMSLFYIHPTFYLSSYIYISIYICIYIYIGVCIYIYLFPTLQISYSDTMITSFES